MAAARDPDEVLCSTAGKANFQRLARLLISGGTCLLREFFDTIHPPTILPTILSNPATQAQLRAARLSRPQWDCLYPSPGIYGTSTDFDVTLLFRLLKTICSLLPPFTGWDKLPSSTDYSVTADLARVKYYRNSVYGHVSQSMEIANDNFPLLWQEIGGALVRIAGHISHTKKIEWQVAIDNCLKDPLTADDQRNVEELERWYYSDMDVKKSTEDLKTSTREVLDGMARLGESTSLVTDKVQGLHRAVRQEAQNIKEELNTTSQDIQEGIGHLEVGFGTLIILRVNVNTLAVLPQSCYVRSFKIW